MAAVLRSQCVFARVSLGKNSKILNNVIYNGAKLTKDPISINGVVSNNYSNYAKSPFVDKIKEQYEFDVIKDKEIWQFVNRLMPFETIPSITPKDNYPSGWIPPKENALSLPYFLRRTKNHVLPVYLKLRYRGQTRSSFIKRIEGDIWLMNDEIKSYLQRKNNKYVETRVHELSRFIEVKGDYVIDIKNWMYEKGF